NKPVGLVVHPGAGRPSGTLMNALLHHTPGASVVPRGGIVHRLDRETSGLLVVARTLPVHTALVEQMAQRQIRREYDAVVMGTLVAGGHCDAPIGRHPVDRKRMAVVRNGRPAVTHYRVAEKFRHHTHLRLRLETGRTHQIRVHMSHLNHPLVGDPLYGNRRQYSRGMDQALRELLSGFRHQALHASALGLVHPVTGEELELTAPIPADLQELLSALRLAASR
ncbi:MAG: RluA family pseudouridine synthase, partial [Gammaproteobacteria bacterium]|nr:RluA family pseudouridine synthase [Gammaproteobacteria bacterium]